MQKTGDVTEKEKYIHILEIALIGGAIIVLAQDIVEWFFGIDFETGAVNGVTGGIPPGIIALLAKAFPFVRFAGAALIVVGVLISVPKLQFLKPSLERTHIPKFLKFSFKKQKQK